ncbi:SagB/ThcOx family dehydrogenase [Methanoregula sp.]|uniref:SagB/ThcOx family dehydrogenase n=1 Tax=Methanoregula sp. TaxID=2052170 RepID=UPI0035620103
MTGNEEAGPGRKGAGQEFMERTKYRYIGKSDQQRGVPQPPLELPADPARPIIDLPRPDSPGIPLVDLREAMEQRTSIRSYAHESLALEELGFLLWCTQGVKTIHGNLATLRTVPSAGARHAFETYILANDVDGLEPGLYRYLALSHRLQLIETDPTLALRMTAACFDQQFLLRSGAVFLWTAVPYRMTWRYGERGYRDLHLDAGHVCQNLYLAAEAVGCGVCAIAAFDDDAMNELLGINGKAQFLIYLATVGKRD